MKKSKILVAVALLALVTTAALAGATPDAQKWLEKMVERKDASFTADYSFDATMAQMGQQMKIAMTGKMMQKDASHTRMEMTTAMTMPGMDEPMNMDMLNVKDGSTMWMQIKNPMMGEQIMKLELAKLEDVESSNPMARNLKNADVVAQVHDLIEKGDFKVAGETGDSVTLTSPVTEAMVSGFGAKLEDLPEDSRTVTLMLDKKNAFPREFMVGGAEPMLHFRFENLEFTDAFADGTFSYTPPEGANVMDLSTMMGMGGQ
jgi:outer membrane lipoprotein-sorting protein